MTDTLKNAVRNTTQILSLADNARRTLHGDGIRLTDARLPVSPQHLVMELRIARDLLNKAIELHEATEWRTDCNLNPTNE